MGIPGPTSDRWYEKKWIVEALAILPPIVAAVVAALTDLGDPAKRTFGIVLVGSAVWLVAASVVKVLHARAQDRERKRTARYEGFQAALHVLYAVVRAQAGLDPEQQDARLRATVHRVIDPRRPEELEQLIDYLGDAGGPAGRRFSVRSGIIGRAVREKAVLAATRTNDDHESFIRELVREWAFTEADARMLRQDRKSWMAVPVFGPGRTVTAVLFFDSPEPAFFTAQIQQLVTNGSSGLMNFVAEAYT